MIEININQWKTKPFEHQIEDVKTLVKAPSYALFNEQGTGKTKTIVDAACVLANAGVIDTVVVVCPASVRSVWCDKDNGEVKKHNWTPSVKVMEFHVKTKCVWRSIDAAKATDGLVYVVTNYEILRSSKHLDTLLCELKGRKVLLVLDESSYIKSRTAEQSKAIKTLRQHCARCVLLNGTPVVNSPLDLWSQMEILSQSILVKHYKSFWFFKAEHCDTVPQRFGKVRFNKIVGYKKLDALQKRIAPYCVRRLKTDCLDLPSKIYTQREVALTKESWERYKMLRNEAVVALEGRDELHLEPNAAVRIMRLSQLTSGHYGNSIGCILSESGNVLNAGEETKTTDVSSEKLDWCLDYLTNDCTAKYVIVWCRWRRERERLVKELQESKKNTRAVFEIYGGQKATQRTLALQAFAPHSGLCESAVLVAQPHAAGFGLNLQVATECIYLSNDYSYGIRLQSEDRCHRPGQIHHVTYIDVLAVGPKGQPTIDAIILKALREKGNLAEFTTSMWRNALLEEK